jgi:hypothetical protein
MTVTLEGLDVRAATIQGLTMEGIEASHKFVIDQYNALILQEGLLASQIRDSFGTLALPIFAKYPNLEAFRWVQFYDEDRDERNYSCSPAIMLKDYGDQVEPADYDCATFEDGFDEDCRYCEWIGHNEREAVRRFLNFIPDSLLENAFGWDKQITVYEGRVELEGYYC